MNRNSSYLQKVIYIALIGILLVPLSFLSRPTTRDADNEIADDGGVISRLRNEHELSQAKLSEIDAASEALRFSLLGMRGVASTSLWLQAIDAKEKEDWNQLEATLNTLIKIQPNFIRVWEYQAHNMSYNVSVEFDDYQFRYAWVKKGINFLTLGIPYNRRDHRITDNLGFFTGMKLGKSDERVLFRQMFRGDGDFHTELTRFPYIHPELRGDRIGFDSGDYGPDNWLLSHQWYRRSEDMVREGVDGSKIPKHRYDFLFYMWAPAQLRNHVMSLQDEERPVDSFVSKWRVALDHWTDYGTKTMETSTGEQFSLEDGQNLELKVAELRRELDLLAPGVREELEAEILPLLDLSDEEKAILDRDVAALNDFEQRIYRGAKQKMLDANANIDREVAEQASDPLKANDLVRQIIGELLNQRSMDKYADTSNYVYWKYRAIAESGPDALEARMAMFDAYEKGAKSRLEPYVDIDPNTMRPRVDETTGESIVIPGAVEDFGRSFDSWAAVMGQYEVLKKGTLTEDLVDDMFDYYIMLRTVDSDWPLDFSLQYLIDRKESIGMNTNLPNSDELADRREREAGKEGDKSEGDKSDGDKSDGDKSDGDKSDGDKSDGDKSDGDKSDGDKSDGDKSDGDKSDGDKSDGDKSDGDKSDGDKSDGDKSDGDKSDGDKSDGDKSDGDKSDGDKSR